MPMNDILGIIEDTVRARFGDQITSVKVARELDHDGDEVLRVVVIFDGKSLDAVKTKGIVRHTRHKLMERDEHTFPIFAFVSKADASNNAEAA